MSSITHELTGGLAVMPGNESSIGSIAFTNALGVGSNGQNMMQILTSAGVTRSGLLATQLNPLGANVVIGELVPKVDLKTSAGILGATLRPVDKSGIATSSSARNAFADMVGLGITRSIAQQNGNVAANGVAYVAADLDSVNVDPLSIRLTSNSFQIGGKASVFDSTIKNTVYNPALAQTSRPGRTPLNGILLAPLDTTRACVSEIAVVSIPIVPKARVWGTVGNYSCVQPGDISASEIISPSHTISVSNTGRIFDRNDFRALQADWCRVLPDTSRWDGPVHFTRGSASGMIPRARIWLPTCDIPCTYTLRAASSNQSCRVALGVNTDVWNALPLAANTIITQPNTIRPGRDLLEVYELVRNAGANGEQTTVLATLNVANRIKVMNPALVRVTRASSNPKHSDLKEAARIFPRKFSLTVPSEVLEPAYNANFSVTRASHVAQNTSTPLQRASVFLQGVLHTDNTTTTSVSLCEVVTGFYDVANGRISIEGDNQISANTSLPTIPVDIPLDMLLSATSTHAKFTIRRSDTGAEYSASISALSITPLSQANDSWGTLTTSHGGVSATRVAYRGKSRYEPWSTSFRLNSSESHVCTLPADFDLSLAHIAKYTSTGSGTVQIDGCTVAANTEWIVAHAHMTVHCSAGSPGTITLIVRPPAALVDSEALANCSISMPAFAPQSLPSQADVAVVGTIRLGSQWSTSANILIGNYVAAVASQSTPSLRRFEASVDGLLKAGVPLNVSGGNTVLRISAGAYVLGNISVRAAHPRAMRIVDLAGQYSLRSFHDDVVEAVL